MVETVQKETHGFQAEVKQLLHLMIHSLYSNREIFLRELISNASDAADKLRFLALDKPELLESDQELKIQVSFDSDNNTITIRDNGIGMNRDEVMDNLGTIARSGTARFLDNMSGDQKQDSQLIGQFGVGFYSVFIVAKSVDVYTRKAGEASANGVHWRSNGEGEFEIETIDRALRGTEIVLSLREDCTEFANNWKLRSVINKYSDHIALPIEMPKVDMGGDELDEVEDSVDVEDAVEASNSEDATAKSAEAENTNDADKPAAAKEVEYEKINQATALWTRSKNEIKDEDYIEFYKHVSHDFEDPLRWVHNKVEGKLDYTSLLYIPKRAPFDLYNREMSKGLKLYVQRVFIMDEAEQFLPMYLRFIKGVVDSNDLSLNVSREILQQDKQVESMKAALTKRVLDTLTKLAESDKGEDKEKYQQFWETFGSVLKEGPAEDMANREKIAGLLRFASTHNESDAQTVSLAAYIGRMKEEQTKIYYLIGESYTAAKNSPHLEIFRKKGIEVLLLADRIDEWMTTYLHEFDGKHMQNIVKANIDEENLLDDEEKKQQESVVEEHKDFVERLKQSLNKDVSEVRVTHRLTESPACLVLNSHDMGAQMREIMKAAGQSMPETKPIMEVNPNHPLIDQLEQESQEDRFNDLAQVVFDQASLAEGNALKDPADYVRRVNKLLLELTSKA